MAIDRQAEGTVSIATAGASNPITCTPAWPTHTTGDLGLLIVTTKHDTEATPTVTAGGGETWDSVGSASGGGGTFGAGTGPIRITVFRCVATSGSMATPTVNLAGTNTGRNMQAVICTARKTVEDEYATAVAFVAEATAGTGWTQAHTSDPGITNGDLLYCIYGVRDDQPAGFSAMGFTATGATISSVTERVDSFTAEGNDQGLGVGTANCTAGTATANGTQTATIGSSETGEMAVLRVREITPKTDPPTLVAYTETAWSGSGTPKSVGASISWEDGDEVYALGMTADSGATLGTPTVSGLTFNAVGSNPVGSGGSNGYKWKAVASGSGSGTIQFSRASGSFEFGGAVWQFRGSDGTGAESSNQSSTPSVSLALSDDHSHVIFLNSDFDAGSTSGYGWTPSGQTEREAAQNAGAYTVYAADWADQAGPATTTYGVTGVSGTFTKVCLEVLGTVAAGVEGTAAGVYTFTGTASGVRETFGTAAGTWAFTGTASGAPRTQGTAAAAFTFTGAAAGNPRKLGTADASMVFTGTASGEVGAPPVTGTADGTYLFTGTAAGIPKVIATTAATLAFTGTASGHPTKQGTAAAAWAFTGIANGVDRAVGTADATLTFTGTAAGTPEVFGQTAGTFTFTGNANGFAGTPPVTGTAAGAYTFTGAAAGVDRSVGTAQAAFTFLGAAQGVPDVQGQAVTTVQFAGTAAGTVTVLGQATGTLTFLGEIVSFPYTPAFAAVEAATIAGTIGARSTGGVLEAASVASGQPA